MRAFGFGIVTLLLAFFCSVGVHAQHLTMRMVAETATPRAGSDVTIALATVPQKGWHGYWRNPGDAGFAPSYVWTLPKGAAMSDPEWPVPKTLIVAGLMNYVYEAPYAPLVRFTVPAGLAAGTSLPIRLKTSYLVCTDTVCVPESQQLAIDLRVGDGAIAPAQTMAFGDWRRAIPRVLDARGTYAQGSDGSVRIAVPYPANAALTDAYFFPIGIDAIEPAAMQTVTRIGDRVIVATRVKPTHTAGAPIDGVLRIGDGSGLSVMAAPGAVPAAGAEGPPAGGSALWTTALLAFAGAVLGGLILNVMPCVFPILSLKALALAKGNTDAKTARNEALAYAAGVVLVCLAMGGIILALRAGGSAVGWAFQLQDPRAILVLMLLAVVIALNLAGLFEVPMPRFAGQAGNWGGTAGSFATGALAAFVATPCSGPFMGAALGAALVLPWGAALAIFGGLGLGLALPFLLLGFVPALRRRLPKPGAWRGTLRHILSVPMWLTALALGWVLGRQAGVDGLTIGLAATLAAGLALWGAGRRQAHGLSFGLVAPIVLIAAAVTGAAVVTAAPPQATAVAGAEPFSQRRLATLRAEKRPVFAYFTADWCLTCKVNEKVAIETDGTRTAFADAKVAVLVGDWTDGDPVLGRFIAAHNRAGVPLYLYYAPGAAEPRVLPQVLTTAMLEQLVR